MSLDCELIIDPDVDFDQPAQLVELIEHAAESESFLTSGHWQMSLRLCRDYAIADLHERFFNDPTPTDVITFPSGDEPDENGAYLGDVVVSVETAADQATDGNHSVAREVAFLSLHGLLHLCGYDDTTTMERDAMHHRQLMLLETWERERGRPW